MTSIIRFVVEQTKYNEHLHVAGDRGYESKGGRVGKWHSMFWEYHSIDHVGVGHNIEVDSEMKIETNN